VKPFDHGGNVEQAARELGLRPRDMLDFSASINPLGIPSPVQAAVEASLPDIVHYPEVDGSGLAKALAIYHDLPAEHFLPGSGSTELIYLLPQVLKPHRALLIAPCFSEYERALLQVRAQIDIFPLNSAAEFRLDPLHLLHRLHRLEPDTDLIMLANPANPTGTGIAPDTVEEIARAVRAQAIVVVDEAFVDFCPERSVLDRLPRHSNLYVLRSFTKFYAIPGLRAGYLAGPPHGVARLGRAREPWTLSVPALAASFACLQAEDYRRRTLAEIPRWRSDLRAGLEKIGMQVFNGEANYLLTRFPESGPDAAEITLALRKQGILVRDCSNFAGLDGRCIRVAVRTPQENSRLLGRLSELSGTR